MASRILQQSTRRFAVGKPSPFFVAKSFVPATSLVQSRSASTSHSTSQQVPLDQSLDILVQQRLKRPVAPHISIYQPQLTWYISGLNRITGVALSGALYVFALSYVAAPLLGWQITSAALAAGFAKWSVFAKVGVKAVAAWPFMFHSFNGLRHLTWDTGAMITNPAVIKSAWAMLAVSSAAVVAVLLV